MKCHAARELEGHARRSKDALLRRQPERFGGVGRGAVITTETDMRRDPSYGFPRLGYQHSEYVPTRGDIQKCFNDRHQWKNFEDADVEPDVVRARSEGHLKQSVFKPAGKDYRKTEAYVAGEDIEYLVSAHKERLPVNMRKELNKPLGNADGDRYVRLIGPLFSYARVPKAYVTIPNKTASLHVLFQTINLDALIRMTGRKTVTVLADPYAGTGWLAEGWFSFLKRLLDARDYVGFRRRRINVAKEVDGAIQRKEVTVLYHHVIQGEDCLRYRYEDEDLAGEISDREVDNLDLQFSDALDDDDDEDDDKDIHALDAAISLRLGFFYANPPKYMKDLERDEGDRFDAASGGGTRFKRQYTYSVCDLISKSKYFSWGRLLVRGLKTHSGHDGADFEEKREVAEITKGGLVQTFYGIDTNDVDVGVYISGHGIITSPVFATADISILRYSPSAETAEKTKFAAFLLPSTFLTTTRKADLCKLPFRHRFFQCVKKRAAVVVEAEDNDKADFSWFIICATPEIRDELFEDEHHHLEKKKDAFTPRSKLAELGIMIPESYYGNKRERERDEP